MKDRLAVFDWNGTLFADMKATHIATNACLAYFDIPPISRETEQELFTFPLIHFYEKVGVKADRYLENAETVGEIFYKTYTLHKNDCTLAKGAKELLSWLRSHNVTCKILSNQNQAILDNDIARFGIGHYFEEISGNIDPATIVTGMNKFERLETFMDENGYRPENSFIVGDSHEEPELARKMNMLGISLSGGLLSPTRLKKVKKDYAIDCLTELPDILIKEWGLEPPKTALAQAN